jgi:hypothetical protein
MHCKNCSYSISHLIETAAGTACPVCSYVYRVSLARAASPNLSEQDKNLWKLIAIGAIFIGLTIFVEKKEFSSFIGKLLLS